MLQQEIEAKTRSIQALRDLMEKASILTAAANAGAAARRAALGGAAAPTRHTLGWAVTHCPVCQGEPPWKAHDALSDSGSQRRWLN